ncbi:MAG TPA: septal ring lytic transglycosylase RlpA family protein [Bacteroidales bacterium]|nr:septal ring lytic transglycosylase RlpA family protein [Bacteroidales bacterium]HPS16005.1 septal ring lytic transglycosylase RlpA family protein [Bacteroidales bacterium]
MTLNKRKALFIFIFILFCFIANAQKIEQTGHATYYHHAFQGHKTSSGEIFDNKKYTAAHATLPLQTLVKITNLYNNKYVIVKINDRCPKYSNRIIDLSQAAAKKIDMIASGIAKIKLEVITESDLNYITPYTENILQNISPDSISVKCNIVLKKFNLRPFENYIFGNIITAQIRMLQLKNKYKEKQKWFVINSLYLLRFQKSLS